MLKIRLFTEKINETFITITYTHQIDDVFFLSIEEKFFFIFII